MDCQDWQSPGTVTVMSLTVMALELQAHQQPSYARID
jgi:hypothetical protein